MKAKRMPGTFSGRRASQSEFELCSFTHYLREHEVTRYLEIGARHGDTFHHVMTSLPAGSSGVAVDLPGGLWGASTTEASLARVIEDLRSRGYLVEMIIGDSTAASVVEQVASRGTYDAILIDGDHSYSGVRSDFLNYQHMSDIIAFHDIVGVDQAERVHNNPVEVPQLWSEIKHAGCTEFVADGSTMGIGVWTSP